MIKTFSSNKPGPNLVVMAGVHGNEPCGIEALAKYMPSFLPKIGSVTFVIGSPKAVAVGKREYQTNLNRMFRSDEELSPQEKETYEYQRSRELIALLANADALLDIHSSTTKQTVPFVICESHAYDCVKYLPVKVVVIGIDTLHPTGTDGFVNKSGGKGICIECGSHDDARAVNVALEAIECFLSYYNIIDTTIKMPEHAQRYIKANWIYKNTSAFTLSREFEEFEKITQGERIGIDGNINVIAPYDSVILFPNDRVEPNQESFLLGVE